MLDHAENKEVVDGNITGWLEETTKHMFSKNAETKLKPTTRVHPCIIDGKRALVYEYRLKENSPTAYEQLESYAKKHGFELREDRRIKKDKSCKFERRLAKSIPLILLASGIFISGVAVALDDSWADTDISVLPDVEVTETINLDEKPYQQTDGKRFITNPYGEAESILAIASQTKAEGEMHRISTRGIKMPSGYVGGFIDCYEKTFSNGEVFKYYEGDGFGALGYEIEEGKVVLDVLAGSAFSSPKLWGAYDQLLGDKDNNSMQLIMGDGSKDGMGLMKASYAIGYTAVMGESDYSEIGNIYTNAVNQTIQDIQAQDGTI